MRIVKYWHLVVIQICSTIVYGYFDEDFNENVIENLPLFDGQYSHSFTAETEEFLFASRPNWPSQDALKKLGRITAAVPIDVEGSQVFVLHRADRAWDPNTFDENDVFRGQSEPPINVGVLAKLNDSELEASYLKDQFYLPHGLTRDHEGNVWITDVAMHQVYKYGPTLDGKPLLILGEKFKPGNDSEHFCKPTHVAVASSGDFFVSDGYCNSRIMKFNPDGKLITQWGKPTHEHGSPGPDELQVPHQLALVEEQDALCVADRENRRVVCYNAGLNFNSKDETGKFLFEIRSQMQRPGPVFGVAFCPHTQSLFALVGSWDASDSVDVQIYQFGSRSFVGSVADSEQGFGMAHSISTCRSTGPVGCLLVSSLNPVRQSENGQETRRIWFYQILSSFEKLVA
ncbi:hypothetical protein P879_04132 [Paragonimus westermani]|uniref:peptidylamidoglycolate lyase n=1 Tax=Paragonimus westermani TaxID=34504 RepID=A0A8T0DPW9_9TREM|nr:hypothetical protein P879_04132 [Paragonimus westermani]